MKRKILAFILLPAVLVSLIAWQIYEKKEKQREEIVGQSIMLTLNTVHYLKKQLDDDFSEVVFDMYVESLDPTKKFLFKKDVQELNKHRHDIDDQLKKSQLDFFELSSSIIKKRIKEAEAYYKEILKQPFNFDKNEEIQLDPEKLEYAGSTEELKDEWRKALKYQTMVRLKNMITRQEDALEREDTAYTEKTFEEMEAEARKKVEERQEDWFENLAQIEREDRFSVYYNAVASAFGPHTAYYPPKDKENFDIQMSGKLEGIGAQLTRRNGYVTVTRIVPGSASWEQGDLSAGDKILKVAQEGEEAVDVVGMRLDEVVEQIRGKKGTAVILTVEKADGTIMEISIVRDVVILEETYARSAMLKDEGESFKAGYIHLPKFYVDFNDKRGRRSSEDVALEVEKLKKENMDGLILDLRNNGGGSLPDVVKIVGLFIDKGPVVQIKSKLGKAQILDDNDRGMEYEGPLMVLVNQGSASASEILAAAMQDYGRAIVVGTSKTFGKGTVQRFYDLDRVIRSSQYDEFKPLGSVKITTQKFYRINGGATQLKGVTPDIILPNRYAFVEMGEEQMENAMPWTKIDGLEYEAWPSYFDVDELKKKSEKRIKRKKIFDLILEDAKRVEENRENTSQTLNLKKFIKEQEELRKASEEIREALDEKTGLAVNQLEIDFKSWEGDTLKMDRFEKWQNRLEKDVHLEEAMNILQDME